MLHTLCLIALLGSSTNYLDDAEPVITVPDVAVFEQSCTIDSEPNLEQFVEELEVKIREMKTIFSADADFTDEQWTQIDVKMKTLDTSLSDWLEAQKRRGALLDAAFHPVRKIQNEIDKDIADMENMLFWMKRCNDLSEQLTNQYQQKADRADKAAGRVLYADGNIFLQCLVPGAACIIVGFIMGAKFGKNTYVIHHQQPPPPVA